MNPFNIRPGDILGEIHDFNLKLAQGFKTLGELDEIRVGASAKEAVYTEDNLVLGMLIPPSLLLIVYALVNRPYMADL